jgi:hypothetical protein
MEVKDELKALQERMEQLKAQQTETSVEELADLADKFKDANETVKSLRDVIAKKMDEIIEEERGDDDEDDEADYDVEDDEMDNDSFLSKVYNFIETRLSGTKKGNAKPAARKPAGGVAAAAAKPAKRGFI